MLSNDEIFEKVGKELDIPKKRVKKIYFSYWRAIREHITSVPLKEELSEEEFLKLQPNVNIPSIGKLYVTPDRYKKMKMTNEIIKKHQRNKYGTTHKEN